MILYIVWNATFKQTFSFEALVFSTFSSCLDSCYLHGQIKALLPDKESLRFLQDSCISTVTLAQSVSYLVSQVCM